MAIRELLAEFSEASGVSGHEGPVRKLVRREFEKYSDEVTSTRLGSLVAVRRGARRQNGRNALSAPKLLLEGHMDEIGLIVTGFEHGFIRFDEVGGFDVRVLPSQNVLVHGRETIPGVIGMRPPHVVPEQELEKPIPMNELFIDVGLPEDVLRERVTVGDVVTIDRKLIGLRNNFVSGKAFDDRAAVVACIDALRQLQGVSLQWDMYVVANVQEEAGAMFAGAATSTFQIHPDVAVALDVSHADQPGIGEVNIVPLDKGPGIASGPNFHPRVHAKLLQVAKEHEIPHRVTTYPGPLGTDAWAMQVVAEGIPTGLLELPLRYMHTSVETVSLNDLERTARLLAAFTGSLDYAFYQEVQGQSVVLTHKEGRNPRRTRTGGRNKNRKV